MRGVEWYLELSGTTRRRIRIAIPLGGDLRKSVGAFAASALLRGRDAGVGVTGGARQGGDTEAAAESGAEVEEKVPVIGPRRAPAVSG